MAYDLSTTVIGPVDCTASQIVASVLDCPQRDGWPTRTPYSDEELLQWAKSMIHWTDTFGFRTAGVIGRCNHETNHLRYTGQMVFGSHNYSGIAATNDGAPGHRFASIDEGCLGDCCHMALYVYGEPSQWPEHLKQYAGLAVRLEAVRSAHRTIKRPDGSLLGFLGVVRTWGDYVNGRHAWTPSVPYGSLDNGYARNCVAKANRVLAQDRGDDEMAAQIPGFEWFPADADHYQRGRTQKIRGGAQHYTAGTSSLNWLAKTSKPEVSVHFLVKHNPTLEDRGWQLVKIEDTAWTTAFANPYTVAIEYEHDGKQPIPDIAYEVLAQTWADITRYVKQHGLGEIEKIAGHKVWVANPQLICPDGIDVARIIKRWDELMRDVQPSPPPADTGWYLHLGGGKHAEHPYVLGFRGVIEGLALARYAKDPNSAALALFGAPIEPEWRGTDGKVYQRTSKVTLVYTPGNAPPWDVAIADRDAMLPERAA